MPDHEAILARLRSSILIRPLAFVIAGAVLALFMLAVDADPNVGLPTGVAFEPESARLLYGTLAGAVLTVAGITFWVRAASVQLAAAQYSPRVVHGFLSDWFQQSMMGLLVGIFTYIVIVFRAIPSSNGIAARAAATPDLAVMLGVILAGGSVLVILVAIRNAVASMQPGALARRITDLTVERIREAHRARVEDSGIAHAGADVLPTGAGYVVRASNTGWVQRIRVNELLGAMPEGTVVRLKVRVGLFVVRGRPLCTVWQGDRPHTLSERAVDAQVQKAVQLGRTRILASDVDYGIQQLVDVAIASLSQGSADAGSAYEVIIHLEIVLRELLERDLPPTVTVDEQNRVVVRVRDFTFDDYVTEAFDRLRLTAAPHPQVAGAVLSSIGALVYDAHELGRPQRATPLRRQASLQLRSCEAAGLLDHDLEQLHVIADRWGLAAAA
ncbi:DUF2254 domain-containing protein [Egibacter rhizosphaerae]|uniref:DUF2254 domain-containing protein n=1 Tax=Egibacter rhizosphaerae TaxID=1670831 RepID=A0A411YHK7_9ACTN|nr:DUF2254 domain-containing protein [Egibacter rhizosphaerae]QBI20586.1 DUF2254 domain-containing protein [Egibacter rhizosphaerae]